MNAFETNATIGPGGMLAFEHLPFVEGQSVHVRIEPPPPTESTPPKQRVLGLHLGAADIADDFDAPLPDEFWLGSDEDPV